MPHMSDPRLVDPRPSTSPTGVGPASVPLPDDLALEAVGRLRLVCLVIMALWVVGLVMNHLVAPFLGLSPREMIPWPPIADVMAIACLALSLVVYWLAP